jgi:dolichol-phosphate mannosyltransferase
VVVPAFDEEAGLGGFLRSLAAELREIAAERELAFTVLVVDDGSSDRTAEVVEDLARHDEPALAFRVLSFSRNFGHQAALVAGLAHAAPDADFVVTMDADGEHPVELVPELVARWSDGEDLVHTARRPAAAVGAWKRLTSDAYYRLLAAASGIVVSPGMADFKLWGGDLLRQVAPFLSTCGSTRVFAAWLAPHAPVVRYEQKVATRRSRFTQRKMWSLALRGLVRYSDVPLRLASVVAACAFLFAATLSVFALWASITGRTVPGWSSLMIALAVFSGLQSLSLGILGEYLLRNTFRQALPQFVLRRRRDTAQPAREAPPRAARHGT